jgi:hypothetical protein
MDTKSKNFEVVTLKSGGMSRHQFRPSLSIGLEPSDDTPCEDQYAKETSNPFQTPIFDLHHSPASYNSTRVSQVSDLLCPQAAWKNSVALLFSTDTSCIPQSLVPIHHNFTHGDWTIQQIPANRQCSLIGGSCFSSDEQQASGIEQWNKGKDKGPVKGKQWSL